jgi:16S rRNA (cytidine1402-2'-O)-methyltransferase
MAMPSGKDSSATNQIPFTGLIIASTPIGNLGDLTPRVETALSTADIVACEDTRHTGKLLASLGIKTKMIAYHDHSGDHVFNEIISALKDGKTIVLVSDAGTPLISDPGYRLVAACRAEGLAVTALPGASAVLAGLAASGLPTDQFHFAGFLPQSMKRKRDRLQQLMAIPTTTIFYESPKRLAATLEIMCDFYPDRDAVVARELTKLHESFYQGTVRSLYSDLKDQALKGEIVLVLGPMAGDEHHTDDQVLALLEDSLSKGLSNKDAISLVTAMSGRPKKDVYNLILKLKDAKNAVSRDAP